MKEREVEYYIVTRRKRGPRISRGDTERPMEVWERAVLDVFGQHPELRRQMLWDAGMIGVNRLRRVLQDAGVSNATECAEEAAIKLAHLSDEAHENRPFAEIDADRERAMADRLLEHAQPDPSVALDGG